MAFGAQVVAQAFTQQVIVFQQQQSHGGALWPGSCVEADTVSPARPRKSSADGFIWPWPNAPMSTEIQPRPARRLPPGSRVRALLLLAVLPVLGLLANRPFVAGALQGRDAQAPQTWLFGAALLVMLVLPAPADAGALRLGLV
jgi:hypothetical protein